MPEELPKNYSPLLEKYKVKRETQDHLNMIEGQGPKQMTLEGLHIKQYKHYVAEDGRKRKTPLDPGRVVIHIRCNRINDDRMQKILKELFTNRMHPPRITFDPDVCTRESLIEMGQQLGIETPGAHTLLWMNDLPDNMFAWINQQMRRLDELLGQLPQEK